MGIYVIKFSACLFVFWLLYILVFEKQNTHHFKRFYLLGAIVSALVIPLITFTKYVENKISTSLLENSGAIPLVEAQEKGFLIEHAEQILWIVYGLGFLLFAGRFLVNLIRILKHIKDNHQIKTHPFVYILLNRKNIPHSFFKYIFLSKQDYEKNTIPEEVILHEKAHSKQLHSLDIIIIELLQVVFWFNPLIYLMKHHIKLNHEFLADRAVIYQGVSTSKYQHLLLQLSSYTGAHQLASTINYSLIKKRFTVMKSHTSKTRIWLSTLLLIPIVALLLFNFAEYETVNMSKEINSEIKIEDDLTSSILDSKTVLQEKVTKKQMAEYNAWAKRFNDAIRRQKEDKSFNFPKIKMKEIERYKYIYNMMTDAQRKVCEPFPNFPPPPPPPPAASKEVKSKNSKKNVIPPSPPAPPAPPKPSKDKQKSKSYSKAKEKASAKTSKSYKSYPN